MLFYWMVTTTSTDKHTTYGTSRTQWILIYNLCCKQLSKTFNGSKCAFNSNLSDHFPYYWTIESVTYTHTSNHSAAASSKFEEGSNK